MSDPYKPLKMELFCVTKEPLILALHSSSMNWAALFLRAGYKQALVHIHRAILIRMVDLG